MTMAIKEVFEAEKKAENIVKNAEEKKSKLIEQARHSSLQKLSDEQKNIDKEQEITVKKKEAEIQKAKTSILADGEMSVHNLEKLSKNKIVKAALSMVGK